MYLHDCEGNYRAKLEAELWAEHTSLTWGWTINHLERGMVLKCFKARVRDVSLFWNICVRMKRCPAYSDLDTAYSESCGQPWRFFLRVQQGSKQFPQCFSMVSTLHPATITNGRSLNGTRVMDWKHDFLTLICCSESKISSESWQHSRE